MFTDIASTSNSIGVWLCPTWSQSHKSRLLSQMKPSPCQVCMLWRADRIFKGSLELRSNLLMISFILANWAHGLFLPSPDHFSNPHGIHPKVNALSLCQEMDMLYIVMEYATGGDLGRRIQVPRSDTVTVGVKRTSCFHMKIPTWNEYWEFWGMWKASR